MREEGQRELWIRVKSRAKTPKRLMRIRILPPTPTHVEKHSHFENVCTQLMEHISGA